MTIAITRRTIGALLAAATVPTRIDTTATDPIFGVIEVARAAKSRLSAVVRAMDDTNPASVEAAYGASHRCSMARDALSCTLPTSLVGIRALVQFHADDVMGAADSGGDRALRDIARAVDALLRTRASPG